MPMLVKTTVAVSLFLLFPARALSVNGWPVGCEVVANGAAQYLICLPPGATSETDLVVFAHGYVDPFRPVQIPVEQLVIDGQDVPTIVMGLGKAFAATSYPKNGLAIKEGIADVKSLVEFYKENGTGPARSPTRVYLVGVSEGGLVTAKALEEPGTPFSGGLALCGPVGDFRKQINYFGDFRVLFDYFFPDINIPNSAVDIRSDVPAAWADYLDLILPAVGSRPMATAQLLKTGGVSADPSKIPEVVEDLLWYNVFATNDAREELHGQPFDNKTRWYSGSLNDLRLNWRVGRFRADDAALTELQAHYQTTGKLVAPLVTMHTTGDHVVPYWHENIYGLKVLLAGKGGKYLHLPVFRYGHCTFTKNEVLLGFALLVAKAGP